MTQGEHQPELATADLAIASSALTKRFRGGQLAVDHVDLAVPRGAVYGFLGPNGSGKTTTIRMLLGLAFPTSGTAELLGVPMPEGATSVLSRVGSLVEGRRSTRTCRAGTTWPATTPPTAPPPPRRPRPGSARPWNGWA